MMPRHQKEDARVLAQPALSLSMRAATESILMPQAQHQKGDARRLTRGALSLNMTSSIESTPMPSAISPCHGGQGLQLLCSDTWADIEKQCAQLDASGLCIARLSICSPSEQCKPPATAPPTADQPPASKGCTVSESPTGPMEVWYAMEVQPLCCWSGLCSLLSPGFWESPLEKQSPREEEDLLALPKEGPQDKLHRGADAEAISAVTSLSELSRQGWSLSPRVASALSRWAKEPKQPKQPLPSAGLSPDLLTDATRRTDMPSEATRRAGALGAHNLRHKPWLSLEAGHSLGPSREDKGHGWMPQETRSPLGACVARRSDRSVPAKGQRQDACPPGAQPRRQRMRQRTLSCTQLDFLPGEEDGFGDSSMEEDEATSIDTLKDENTGHAEVAECSAKSAQGAADTNLRRVDSCSALPSNSEAGLLMPPLEAGCFEEAPPSLKVQSSHENEVSQCSIKSLRQAALMNSRSLQEKETQGEKGFSLNSIDGGQVSVFESQVYSPVTLRDWNAARSKSLSRKSLSAIRRTSSLERPRLEGCLADLPEEREARLDHDAVSFFSEHVPSHLAMSGDPVMCRFRRQVEGVSL